MCHVFSLPGSLYSTSECLRTKQREGQCAGGCSADLRESEANPGPDSINFVASSREGEERNRGVGADRAWILPGYGFML